MLPLEKQIHGTCVCMYGHRCASINRPKVQQVKAITACWIPSKKIIFTLHLRQKSRDLKSGAIHIPLIPLYLASSIFLFYPFLFTEKITSASLCLWLIPSITDHKAEEKDHIPEWAVMREEMQTNVGRSHSDQ